jgi:DDE superfamily endonuclease
MAEVGEATCVDGLATRVQRPREWANQKVLYDAKRHGHTAQGLVVSTVWGDLLWLDGGWPGSCHEHELLALSGLGKVVEASGVATLLDRGFRGLAKPREHWHAPVGDRRTKDRLSDGQRAFNRVQARLRALVEQAIGHLADAWSLRRWRGLLYRVRDVLRGCWQLHRHPSSGRHTLTPPARRLIPHPPPNPAPATHERPDCDGQGREQVPTADPTWWRRWPLALSARRRGGPGP